MIEHVILGNLVRDEKYCRAVLPYLRDEYFNDPSQVQLFKIIQAFVGKYNTLPTTEALVIEVEAITGLNEKQHKELSQLVSQIEVDENTDRKFLLERTEEFAKERALFHALRESIAIVDDPKAGNTSSIPKMLQDALAVSFDPSIGHDFFEDAGKRFEEYHAVKNRLPFDLDYMNRITNGGLLPKTMMILMAGTGVGKSLFMCHFAAANLMQGKNVLYFTMEMSEQQIGQRIDHNLLGVPEHELMQMSLETYNRRLARVREKSKGKLIIKEYASGTASAGVFRHVINELRMKKNFVPDVIYVDYLNICASSRMKMGGTINTYVLVKAVAEELRGLAQEFGIPLVTATQTNRDGLNSSDVDITNTSESVGVPQTCDYMLAIISDEELEQLGQVMVKQLKNRYGDPTRYRKFVLGIDRSRMKLFDVEQEAQDELIADKAVMDTTKFGEEDAERQKPKSRFSGFR